MTDVRAVLAGTGIAIPPYEIDNHRLSRIIETNDDWIRERSGISTRYYVEAGVGSADLGAEAAAAALADGGVEPGEVDYIVCATMTPDHYFPGTGTLLQQKLGLRPLPALDIRQQCAGFAYGLQVVDALIRSRIARTVLLVGTDVHTSLMPFSNHTFEVLHGRDEGPISEEDYQWNSRFRHLLVLFGDGAGAMVFRGEENGGERGILDSSLYGDGNHLEILHVPGLGSKHRPFVTPEMIAAADTVPPACRRRRARCSPATATASRTSTCWSCTRPTCASTRRPRSRWACRAKRSTTTSRNTATPPAAPSPSPSTRPVRPAWRPKARWSPSPRWARGCTGARC
jgi:3-oxoacyl-[acyl-carrier-protein] synthase III